jgi:hypothetical protein
MVEEDWKNAERLIKYTYYVLKYECSPQCVISKYFLQIIESIKLFPFYRRVPIPGTTLLFLKNCNKIPEIPEFTLRHTKRSKYKR